MCSSGQNGRKEAKNSQYENLEAEMQKNLLNPKSLKNTPFV